MRNQTFRSYFAYAILALAIASGCTKKKEEKNEVDPNAYMAKAVFVNAGANFAASASKKQFHLSRGVEEADSDNTLGATPGKSEDFGIVEARITEKELQFVSMFDPQGQPGMMKIVASYPITDHFDIERETNDFGEKTHKIVENRDKPWNQRAYIRVDWQSPSNSLSKFTHDLEVSKRNPPAEQNTTLLETPTVSKDGYINFLVETSVVANQIVSYTFPYYQISSTGYRIVYRTSLMPVKNDDFKPVRYSLEDFTKFGYFFTQQNFLDPEKGLLEKNIEQFANVHNVCEKGRAESCSTNQIVWVLSKDFPDMYKPEARKAVEAWNQTFREALNRNEQTDKAVVVLNEEMQANISDPRYNVLGFYPERTKAGLLGVAQWVSNPQTGELVGVRATAYQDGINSVVGSVDTVIDLILAGDKELTDVIGTNPLGSEEKFPSPYDPNNAARFDALQKGILGFDNAKSTVQGSQSPAAMVASLQERMDGGTVKANARLATYLTKIQDMLAVQDTNLFSNINEDSALPFPQRSGGVLIPNLNGMERLIFANEQARAEKQARLAQAESGVHGTELVDEAAIRYLKRLLEEKNLTMADLKNNRQMIKEKIAKETYFSTTLHEMGHAFGLRHNFRGSADKANYPAKYAEIKAQLAAGKPGVTKADLDQYAQSSIMDYGHDFYSDEGGLGPYDHAAIKYAYNRSINKQTDPIVNRKNPFQFCTDHQVDESILCRRFDKGANVSEVTQSLINTYNQRYSLSHYRRGRIDQESFLGWGNPEALMNAIRSRYMIPIRQVVDEFQYSLAAGGKVPAAQQTGGYCDYKFIADSVAKKEIAPICTAAQMEAAGVNPNDFETIFKALYDENGNVRVKDPSDYIPYGMGDLLWSNRVAKNFFADVLGSAEPGRYLVLGLEQEVNQARGLEPAPAANAGAAPVAKSYQMLKLPDADSDDAALEAFAVSTGRDPAQFKKLYKAMLVNMPLGPNARQLETIYSEAGGHPRIEILGSWWDKYAAITTLAARDIGVLKYDLVKMAPNVYFSSLTKDWGGSMFGKILARKASGNYLSSAEVTLPNWPAQQTPQQGAANAKNAEVVEKTAPRRITVAKDAALNIDLQAIAGAYAVGALTTTSDMSYLNRLRVCANGEGGCEPGPQNLPVASVTVNGKTYRAVQTYAGDSISFNMITEASKLQAQRTASEDSKKPSDNEFADALLKLSGSAALRARLDSELKKYPVHTPIRNTLIVGFKTKDATGKEQFNPPIWDIVNAFAKAYKTSGYFTLAERVEMIPNILKQMTDMVDGQLAQVSAATPDASTPVVIADLTQIKTDLAEATAILNGVVNSGLAIKGAPLSIGNLTSSLERSESNIIYLRRLMKQEE
ncbi:MAG: hypothetical protein EOP05_03630 [Proteobacteria bacterium]|nr:MAG: hypothetical protein EOP05_03630 [Pseudomonadota bacterium]